MRSRDSQTGEWTFEYRQCWTRLPSNWFTRRGKFDSQWSLIWSLCTMYCKLWAITSSCFTIGKRPSTHSVLRYLVIKQLISTVRSSWITMHFEQVVLSGFGLDRDSRLTKACNTCCITSIYPVTRLLDLEYCFNSSGVWCITLAFGICRHSKPYLKQ